MTMTFAAWGQQEKASFDNGKPLEFILAEDPDLREGEQVELSFFNAQGVLDTLSGIVSQVKPGLITIERA
jgi:hypothetical protein